MTKIDIERLQQLISLNLSVNEGFENYDVVVQRLLHAIEIITDCEATSFLVRSENKDELVFRYASGLHYHSLIGLEVPSGEGIAHRVIKEKRGHFVNDVQDSEYYKGIDRKLNYRTRNIMAMPLFDYDGTVFGVVEACNKKRKDKFSSEDLEVFQIFCRHAERILRHAHLFLVQKKELESLALMVENIVFPKIVYSSTEIASRIQLLEKLAESENCVTLYGEPGVGKTILAKQIHIKNFTPISFKHPFVVCNCMEVSNNDDIEYQNKLFWGAHKKSHRKNSDKFGYFQRAHNGTLLFREIGQLSLSLQKLLLDFLKSRKNQIQDSPYPSPILKIRILCTTSENLEELVEKGLFLEELYDILYRLPIYVSPLRNRAEDVPTLAKHFFEYFIMEYNKKITTIDHQVYNSLKKYNWPGNVSELKNVIENSVIMCTKDTIHSKDLAFYKDTDSDELEDQDFSSLKTAVDAFKKKYIYKKLMKNNWNHTITASNLNIQRSYLSKLVRIYKLKFSSFETELSDELPNEE